MLVLAITLIGGLAIKTMPSIDCVNQPESRKGLDILVAHAGLIDANPTEETMILRSGSLPPVSSSSSWSFGALVAAGVPILLAIVAITVPCGVTVVLALIGMFILRQW